MPENQHQNAGSNDILIVDDKIPNLQLLSELLGREGYQVRPANNPQLAIDSALAQPPKLILLDVKMPEMDGFEVCRRLKQEEQTRDIPIIFVSALQDVQNRILGFEAGGVDFITKPFQEEEVLARVRTHVELRNMQLNLEEIVAERTAELTKSEAKYRGLVDNSIVGVFTSNINGQFVFINDAMVEMFDFDSLEHMMAEGSLSRWSDPNRRKKMLALLNEHGTVTNFEAETITNTGRHIHVLFSVKLLGENIFGMVMDITDRKDMELRLVKSSNHLRRAQEVANSGSWELNLKSGKLFWSDEVYRIFGLPQGSPMSYEDFLESVLPEDRGHLERSWEAALRGEPYDIEHRTHVSGEVKWLREKAEIEFDGTGRAVRGIGTVQDVTDRKQAEIELKEAYTEIEQLQMQLQAESTYLQEEIKLEHNFENIIGQSEPLKYVLHRVEMVAPQDSTVILMGETGTGKELIARALHQLGSRNKRPLVKVNCAALPAELIESELFGREKGAFTGATTTQAGRFELANKSTLFLDEIGELPLELQAKLLRVLESGEFERLGSSRTLHSDVRILAATNRDLEEAVRKKRFREDLWYRLKVFPITIPPLRDRTEDIPLLVDNFVQHRFSRGV